MLAHLSGHFALKWKKYFFPANLIQYHLFRWALPTLLCHFYHPLMNYCTGAAPCGAQHQPQPHLHCGRDLFTLEFPFPLRHFWGCLWTNLSLWQPFHSLYLRQSVFYLETLHLLQSKVVILVHHCSPLFSAAFPTSPACPGSLSPACTAFSTAMLLPPSSVSSEEYLG